ncbi:MAG: bifunctional methionine sulfoxide reductase B/A protein [Burkholderiales bacterium]|nr:bifunctional methionine sulfoxide reductase B/A protein [Burkholderiales bacterium]
MIKTDSLTPLQYSVIINKSTEAPFTGEYTDNTIDGTYLCRNCGLALFEANNKFHSGCGWPSFDLELENTIKRIPDIDGRRTEILCNRCNAHLGHVFHGENLTTKNTRYCVNSVALDFVAVGNVVDTEEIILAGGCFWGIEYYLQKLPSVLLTQVGYCGGIKSNPSYKEVCSHNTNHLEVVRVIFDPTKINLTNLLKYFFEIHDPTQTNGQGLDVGNQYLSAVFCYNLEQQTIAKQVITLLTSNGYTVATTVRESSPFWIAEEYHRNYYLNNNNTPYCHKYTKRF